MLKLIDSVEAVRKREIDEVFISARDPARASRPKRAASGARRASWRRRAGQALQGRRGRCSSEGEAADGLHLIRARLGRRSRATIGGRDVVLSYVAAGNYVGEMALLARAPRTRDGRRPRSTTETVRLDARRVQARCCAAQPEAARAGMQARVPRAPARERSRCRRMPTARRHHRLPDARRALGEATDVLLIDEIAVRALRQLREGLRRDARRHLAPRSRGGPDVRADPRADLVPALRAPALHEGLPAGRDPPRAERRGLHRTTPASAAATASATARTA